MNHHLSHTALVVNASGVNRKLWAMLVGKLGYANCLEVASPELAMQECEKAPPRVILLDDEFKSGQSALDFVQQLRCTGNRDTMVILCTSSGDVAVIARALHAGANEYITKPVNEDNLRAKLQELGLI